MQITREELLKQRQALMVRRDEANAMANQAAGAIAMVEALINKMDDPEDDGGEEATPPAEPKNLRAVS